LEDSNNLISTIAIKAWTEFAHEVLDTEIEKYANGQAEEQMIAFYQPNHHKSGIKTIKDLANHSFDADNMRKELNRKLQLITWYRQKINSLIKENKFELGEIYHLHYVTIYPGIDGGGGSRINGVEVIFSDSKSYPHGCKIRYSHVLASSEYIVRGVENEANQLYDMIMADPFRYMKVLSRIHTSELFVFSDHLDALFKKAGMNSNIMDTLLELYPPQQGQSRNEIILDAIANARKDDVISDQEVATLREIFRKYFD
jgi:hypothetical protein